MGKSPCHDNAKPLTPVGRVEPEILGDGLAGDRSYGVLDLESRTVLSAKRVGQLLLAFARLGDAGPLLSLPGSGELGEGPALDAALTQWLGRPSRLVGAKEHGPGTYQATTDFEHEGASVSSWQGPAGRFVDSYPIHLLTTATLRACAAERPELEWSPRRFRPNILLEAEGAEFLEEGWVGRHLSLGEAELQVVKPCARCVMTTRAQPGGLERELDVLRHVHAAHASNLGVLATVVIPGMVHLGDTPELVG